MLLMIEKNQKSDFQEEDISQLIQDVSMALEEKGYDPVNQIVGYLMSGDPGYISSYKDSRKKITKVERTQLLNCLVKGFLS